MLFVCKLFRGTVSPLCYHAGIIV